LVLLILWWTEFYFYCYREFYVVLILDLQDFKFYYDAKFGRKKADKNGETADEAVVSNGGSLGVVSNGNPHAKKASEMAFYEQLRTEVLCFRSFLGNRSLLLETSLICASSCFDFVFQGQNQIHSNGFSPVNMDERPYDLLSHHFVFLDSVVSTYSFKNVKIQFYQKQIGCHS